MPERYFHTLPPEIPDARFFRLLERMGVEFLRRGRGWTGGDRVIRKIGGAVEFAGHRNYDPGDDLRYLDWHLLARLDDPYTKTFHEQEYYYVHLLIDTSASMAGGRDGIKFRVTQDVATAVSFLVLNSDDRLRLVRFPGASSSSFDYAGQRFLIGPRQMPLIRRFLSEGPTQGVAAFEEGIARYLHRNHRRMNTVVILSDFLESVPILIQALSRFIRANTRLILIRIIAEEDRSFPPEGAQIRVRDVETGRERVLTLDETNLKKYESEFGAHRSALIAFCRTHRVGYAEVDTTAPWYDPQRNDSFLRQLSRLEILHVKISR